MARDHAGAAPRRAVRRRGGRAARRRGRCCRARGAARGSILRRRRGACDVQRHIARVLGIADVGGLDRPRGDGEHLNGFFLGVATDGSGIILRRRSHFWRRSCSARRGRRRPVDRDGCTAICSRYRWRCGGGCRSRWEVGFRKRSISAPAGARTSLSVQRAVLPSCARYSGRSSRRTCCSRSPRRASARRSCCSAWRVGWLGVSGSEAEGLY